MVSTGRKHFWRTTTFGRLVRIPLIAALLFGLIPPLSARAAGFDVSDAAAATSRVVPLAPSLVAPHDGATERTLTPTFQWNTVSGADYYGLYIRDISSGEGPIVFDSQVDYGPIPGMSFDLPAGYLIDGKTYRWNMRSHSSAGWGTSFSTRWTFSTDTTITESLANAFDYPVGTPRAQGGDGSVTQASDGDGWYNAQDFGDPYPDYGGLHPGEDWNDERGGSSDVGAPVYAVADGIVTAITTVAGQGIAIRHRLPSGESVYSVYLHVTIAGNLGIGSVVSQGERIADIADISSSGMSPHLHFELRTEAVDPLDWYPNDLGNGYYASAEDLASDGFTVDPSDFIDSHRNIASPSTSDAGYAVIVAGDDDPGFDMDGISANGNTAYRALRALGFDDERILYLNSDRPQDVDGDGDDEVDDVASLESFQRAMETWAPARVSQNSPLTLYLVGHGATDTFSFNDADGVGPSLLDYWLGQMPGGTPMFIVIDACYSGSFITPLGGDISSPNRVIVTSSGDDSLSDTVLFAGSLFSRQLWQRIGQGENVRDAFISATNDANRMGLLAGKFWDPWLDDNGDGVGHSPLFMNDDGGLAATWVIGTPGGPPSVGEGALSPQAFRDCYDANGGASVLGYPVNAVHRWGSGLIQDFRGGEGYEGAIMQPDGASSANAVYGSIWSWYLTLGGAEGPLGYPLSSESSLPVSSLSGATSRYNKFQGGNIVYHASGDQASLTVFLGHGVFNKWEQLGYGQSPIGLPTSDEREASASGAQDFLTTGVVADFEGGHIYWHRSGSRANDAFEVHGAIDGLYGETGGPASWLGFPVSDEYTDLSGYARSDFEGGYITTDDGVNYRAFPYAPSNTPPDRPYNIAPAFDSQESLTPLLEASSFSDPDDDVHAASRWQILTISGDYSSPLFDSGTDTSNLTNITVPSGTLDYGTFYHWRVRYQDSRGAWSEWSMETAFTTASQDAATWHVDDDLADYPNADFARIQDAVNAAKAGDTIMVYPGIYAEYVNVNKFLRIQSVNGSGSTIVQAPDGSRHVFEITANLAEISGFTIQGAPAYGSAQTWLTPTSQIGGQAGVYINEASRNVIRDNILLDSDLGILMRNSSNSTIRGNNSYGEGMFYGSGIYAFRSMDTIIESNSFDGFWQGITLQSSASSIIRNNISVRTWQGILLEGSSSNSIQGNAYDPIELRGSSDNIIQGNTVIGKNFGIYVWANSSGNVLSRNNLIKNEGGEEHWRNGYDAGGANSWDDGLEGNYWSDYVGLDADGDGIGDAPHQIAGAAGARDNHPLMGSYFNDVVAPNSVGDLIATEITDRSVTLTWTAPGDDEDVGNASQYEIRYSTSPITESNWDSANQWEGEPAPEKAWSSESHTVTGLSYNTTYYFALKTADEVSNWSSLSNVASGRTLGIPWQVTSVEEGRVFNSSSLAIAADGKTHIAYGGGQLYYATWNGESWRTEQIERSAGAGASLALDHSGNPAIAYQSVEGLKLAHFNGVSWQIDLVEEGGGNPSLAFGPDGNPGIAYVVNLFPTEPQVFLRFAWFDGASWQAEAVEGVSFGAIGSPSLVFDSSGTAHIAYLREHPDFEAGDDILDVRLAHWSGESWVIETIDSEVLTNSGSSLRADLALDRSDSLHVAYNLSGEGLMYARSSGLSWEIEVVDGNGYDGALLFDGLGRPAIAYVNDGLRLARPNGTAWRVETLSGRGRSPSLALHPSGNPAVTYLTRSDGRDAVEYAYLSETGWDTQIVDAAQRASEGFLSLAFDSSGYPAIAYRDDWPYPDLKLARWDGTSWQIETVDSGNVYSPSLAFDPSGNPVIAYDNWGLKYAHFDGDSWDFELVDTGQVESVSLALDSRGNPGIAYVVVRYFEDTADFDYEYHLKYAHFEGSSWEIRTLDANRSLGIELSPSSLAFDSQGDNPAIAYCDPAGLKYAHLQGESWDIQVVGDGGDSPSLAFDLQGNPEISYGYSGFLWYASFDGSSWVDEFVAGEHWSEILQTSLVSDPSGNSAIAYYDRSIGLLSYAHKYGSTWSTQSLAGGDGGPPSLAFDPVGNPAIAYSDVLNGDLKYAFGRISPPNHPPEAPSNVWPASASSVSHTPSLQSSPFSDPDSGDTHAASQWQTRTASGDYASPLFDSGVDAVNLTSIAVPSGILGYGTTYYWRVRHQDSRGVWSEWSVETSFTTVAASEDEVVTFPDSYLEAAIREAISKPSGDIYQSDLDGLTTLNASSRRIVDLAGLEHATSLTVLDLSNNQISNIAPLSALTSLTRLMLYINQISDLSPLAGLTGLTELSLSYNQISNLLPLAGLAGLTELYLHYNQISDLSPLAGLTRLTRLSLSGNQISDISPLVNNAGLAEGDKINLQNNPLSAASLTDYIPQLEARGVTVLYTLATNQPPTRPTNVSPAPSAPDIRLTPTLQSSAFSDPDSGDTHAASQWQVTAASGDYSSPAFDSGVDAVNLTSIAVPSGILGYGTTYYWRVRHQDSRGVWSEWSVETSFSTAAEADTLSPAVSLVPLPPGPIIDNVLTFSGVAADSTSPIVAVEYRLDGGPWTPAEAVDGAFDSRTEVYAFTTTILADGPHSIEVRATDAAGNTGNARIDFLVDGTPPTVTIDHIPSLVNSPLSRISGTAFDGVSGVEDVRIMVHDLSNGTFWDGAGWVDAETWLTASGTTFWSYDAASIAFTEGGAYVVQARATDAAGHESSIASTGFSYNTGLQTHTWHLVAGWQLNSLPVTPESLDPAIIFASLPDFEIYAWDGGSQSYTVPTELQPGVGYWLHVSEDAEVQITGVPVTTYATPVSPGWSLLGALASPAGMESVQTSTEGALLPYFFTWDAAARRYVLSETLAPGVGYFVLFISDSMVTVALPRPMG